MLKKVLDSHPEPTTITPMNNNTIITNLPSRVQGMLAIKGQIVTLKTVRTVKTRKGQAEVLKESTFQCRLGVNYDNIASVQEKREDGTLPAENAGLPWGEWLVFPHIIAHKGNHYYRCTKVNSGFIPKTCYYQNGKEISKDEAKVVCLASEFREDQDNEVFTIKIESIVEVNGQIVI
jgi:hypothetical protein